MTSMTELEAARLAHAALVLIRDKLPGTTDTAARAARWQQEIGAALLELEQAAPPWEPEPGPSSEIPWSQVACGDKVLAPNGTWYPVDAISRTGRTIKALLVSGGKLIPTVRDAGDMVKVERGPVGQAMDLFAAGGINLETIEIGAEK